MAPVLKTGIPERVSGVRIPPSPPLLLLSSTCKLVIPTLSLRGIPFLAAPPRSSEVWPSNGATSLDTTAFIRSQTKGGPQYSNRQHPAAREDEERATLRPPIQQRFPTKMQGS